MKHAALSIVCLMALACDGGTSRPVGAPRGYPQMRQPSISPPAPAQPSWVSERDRRPPADDWRKCSTVDWDEYLVECFDEEGRWTESDAGICSCRCAALSTVNFAGEDGGVIRKAICMDFLPGMAVNNQTGLGGVFGGWMSDSRFGMSGGPSGLLNYAFYPNPTYSFGSMTGSAAGGGYVPYRSSLFRGMGQAMAFPSCLNHGGQMDCRGLEPESVISFSLALRETDRLFYSLESGRGSSRDIGEWERCVRPIVSERPELGSLFGDLLGALKSAGSDVLYGLGGGLTGAARGLSNQFAVEASRFGSLAGRTAVGQIANLGGMFGVGLNRARMPSGGVVCPQGVMPSYGPYGCDIVCPPGAHCFPVFN